ncbi:hypothetical protein OG689_40850 [Kitasatospora sp. NBC_00240]|uniref:hypothetical protein n=1 Tax=Kitasatospora sp. NBC_00240 TaxID=2903567 RepID=UPI00224FB320|nr:hypothetical protein [Kitasatospora sp. NBC_00240]MCX5215518.1 hypothetical protein [Kitasatospora sp. NBC_00240]
MRIGVRLGRENAYGVLLDRWQVLATATVPMAGSVSSTVDALLRGLARSKASTVESVTWDVSAVLKATLRSGDDDGHAGHSGGWTVPKVRSVAAIRILPRAPRGFVPGTHPSDLVRSLVAWRGSVTGGHDLFGTELARLDSDAAGDCADVAKALGLTALAVTATGASATAAHEERVATRVLEVFPNARLCLSHELGGLGLLEREATTIVNAALFGAAEELVTTCESATSRLGPGVSCWFATADGGRVPARRFHRLPVLGLSATRATTLTGVAVLAERPNALIALAGRSTILVGQVRDGLPHVESDLSGEFGARLTTPQPVVSVKPVAEAADAATWLAEHPQPIEVIAPLDEVGLDVAERLCSANGDTLTLTRQDADLAAVGAACTEPSAWLDLLVPVEASDELDEVQSQAEQQAMVQVATNGARPGSERIVRSTAAAVGYLRICRLQIRAGSGGEPEATS